MNNPFLIQTSLFKDILEKKISSCQSDLTIMSSFVKQRALQWIANAINTNADVRLVVRLTVNDILEGASDFEICQYALDNGWKIGLKDNLHAKVYMIDKKSLLVGSNNLTPSGLGLNTEGNLEFGVCFEPEVRSFEAIENVMAQVNWLTQEKVDLMKEHIEKQKKQKPTKTLVDWPEEIYVKDKDNLFLWSFNFPDLTPSEYLAGKQTLFIEPHSSTHSADYLFYNSDAYLWLLKNLKEHKEGYTNFGWLTSQIHNVVLDNPVPYRSQIKDICELMFSWVEEFSRDINIVQHTKTRSLELR